jgi:hypothetical protein
LVEVLVVSEVVVAVPFLWCFLTFFVVVLVVSDDEVFWAFLAAGAAIRKGTATAAKRVEVNSFFM